ncbi:hypothetical protein OHB49_02150 [Streptomyces sp. NBC_01717]|uniref:hypothetical protein n=1 Tax=Streptomyces sp. NBC_01717 TaxID=2975918 RepID=UPI002E377A5B|nr:hypothetical protein [Streptomyces sp. NBC_01717]
MTEEAKNSEKATGTSNSASSATGPGAGRTSQAAGKKTTAAAGRATEGDIHTAEAAKSSASDAQEATAAGTRSISTATQQVSRAATAGVESGKRAAASVGGKVTSGALTIWTAVKHRNAVVAGAGATVVGVAFAAGRHTAKRKLGPVTRLTGGRI